MPVVRYLQQLESAILNSDLDARCARVERILQKFLDRVGGAVDNLEGGRSVTVVRQNESAG
jgi:hypothetical protein